LLLFAPGAVVGVFILPFHAATGVTSSSSKQCVPRNVLQQNLQVLEETTGHARTFARSFSFLAVF
jgi:hypothetical protein